MTDLKTIAEGWAHSYWLLQPTSLAQEVDRNTAKLCIVGNFNNQFECNLEYIHFLDEQAYQGDNYRWKEVLRVISCYAI